MLKSMRKLAIISMIAVMSCSANNLYPKWLTDVPKSKEVIYGIGTVKLTGLNDGELKKRAYCRALDEIALSSDTKVNALVKDFVQIIGTGENAVETKVAGVTFKITAYGIGDIGKVENEYTAGDGNYFILVSTPIQKIKIDKNKPIMIKGHEEESRELENGINSLLNSDKRYFYSSKCGSTVDYEEFVDNNATVQQKEDQSKLPAWIFNPNVEGIESPAIGISGRYPNESLFLSLEMAIANARIELANNMRIKVSKVLSSDNTSNKYTTSETLKHSEIYKIYINDSSVYVLVGINKNESDDKDLWEQFKRQKARENSK